MFKLRQFIGILNLALSIYYVQTQVVNLAFDKKANSTVNDGKLPCLAVDGDTEQIYEKCAHTQYEPNQTVAWWQVDLGQTSGIRNITIYHGIDNIRRLNGFQIVVSMDTDWRNKTPCYSDTEPGNLPNIVTICNCTEPGRYVTIFNYKYHKNDTQYGPILELCEVQVYGCGEKKFGLDCNLTCNCREGSCHSITGVCDIPECEYGWKGDNCSIPCEKNTFGGNCNSTCHCLNGSCNVSTGICSNEGCKPGWLNDTCSQPCASNKFGYECNTTCHCNDGSCNNSDGRCIISGCKPGWKGNSCSTQCTEGSFGPDCKDGCHCLNETCDRMDGTCDIPGCKPGYQSKSCSKKCVFGTFGLNCTRKCHCLTDTCNNVNGICNSDGCIDGWNGSTCSEKIKEVLFSDPESSKSVTGVIVAVVSVVIVIAMVVIAFIVYKKRRSFVKCKRKTCRKNIDDPLSARVNDYDLGIASDDLPKNRVTLQANETEYENLEPRTTNISIQDLKTRLIKSTIKEELEKEYEDIKNEVNIPMVAGEKAENKDKNRFLAIFPYDHSRVVLETLPGVPNSDYINANYIDDANGRDKSIYVAAQGPKSTTVDDFWRMVWQVKSGKIVMLTNPKEKRKVKCFKYWPDVSQVQVFGDLKIELESEVDNLYFTNRQLRITHLKTGEIRNIHHLHFTTWPDHGTPDSSQLVLFHRNYMQTESDLYGPTIVHCSAGVGRTGTFIALDALYKYGKENDTVDVFEYVKVMRKNRMSMVQTKEQYMFIYEALLESFEFQETSLSKDEFLQFGNQEKRIKAEFRKLVNNIPKYDKSEYKGGMEKCNLLKNRSQNILPVDKFRPYLMSNESARSSYINAVIIPSYKDHTGFLVTQLPLLDTVVDFWCLVYDHESLTIVTLDCTSENEQILNRIPSNKSKIKMGKFSIHKTTDSTVVGEIKESEVCIMNEDTEKVIKVFEVQGWKHGNATPTSGQVLFKLIEMVENWKNSTPAGPITVVCMDGARCCGLFCGLYNIIKKLRYEDSVDIYQTVKQLQVRRPEFFSSFEQFKFFYNVVKEYIENANIYVN